MRDPVGVIIATCMAGAIMAGAVTLTVVAVNAQAREDAYRECVASIPTYLDPQEIVYQEQECKP